MGEGDFYQHGASLSSLGLQSASGIVERESDVNFMKGTFLNKGKSVCLAAAVKRVRKTPPLITVEPR